MAISLDSLLKGHDAQFSSEILRDAFEQERAEANKALVTAARTVLSHGEKTVQNLLSKVRQLRKSEAETVKELKTLSAAFEYFKKSGIPFPYYLALYGKKETALLYLKRVFVNTNIDWENLPEEVWNIPQSE